jgi:glycosyltransferase involved in cell wall biosynthesis
MIVTIDGTDWLYGERAVRRHVVSIVERVGAFGEGIEYRVFLDRFRPSPHGGAPASRPHVRVIAMRCPRRLFDLLNKRLNILPVDRVTGKTDIFHAAGSNTFRCRARQYLYTVGGLAAFVRPDLLDPAYAAAVQNAFRAILPRVTHFLAVSETTRRELMTLFDIPAERITAIPLGVDAEFRPLDPVAAEAGVRSRFPIRRPYALYVGGIQRNKNIVGLIDAFAHASRGALASFQLVLVGPRWGKDPDIEKAVRRAGLGDRLIFTGPQHGETLVQLYAAASLFVFVSFYEGWTSPPLEAMACGVPVVASRASSIPETVGDAALLVDPLDAGEVSAAMTRVIEDQGLAASLRDRGFARVRQFTWDRSVGATVKLYLRLGA